MRNKKKLLRLSRSPLGNQMRAITDSVLRPPPAYTMQGLVSENKWMWIRKNLSNLWKSHYRPYPGYHNPSVNNGIFKMATAFKQAQSVALLSDWASNTTESRKIGKLVGIPDYSIHLGDTYYVGNEKEIGENFNRKMGGSWPYGVQGSFAMLGNHEMYSSGRSYFTQLLPLMGLYENGAPIQTQLASYFCLENNYWRIIGLDTGYDSISGLFGASNNTSLDLTGEQKNWLQNTVRLNDDRRGLIFLSHHPCFSAFEMEYPNPLKSIASLLDPARDVLWFWGHEHRLAVYGGNPMGNGASVFGRCIGNSGMPVELSAHGNSRQPARADPSPPENRHLVAFDQRIRETLDGRIPLGHNGFTTLTLLADQLHVEYFDDNGGVGSRRKILEEKWRIDVETGKLHGIAIHQSLRHGLTVFGDRPTDAITVQH